MTNKSIQITINNRTFNARLNITPTVEDFLRLLPLKLSLQRYAGHEYYSKLPQKLKIKDVPMTSSAHAGGIYYFDGWSAFTLVYADAEIAPYKVVHLGDLEPEAINLLEKSDTLITTQIETII